VLDAQTYYSPIKDCVLIYRNIVRTDSFVDEVRASALEQVSAILSNRWNTLNNKLVYDSIVRDEDYYELESDHLSSLTDAATSPEEAAAIRREYFFMQESEVEAARLEMNLIEEQLSRLGTRV
jgi:hypothetical protein